MQLPAGPVFGPLRIEGAENLRIVAQPDTVLICGDKEPVPCLLIAESQAVVIEGLMVQGREAGASIRLRESSVELTGLRLHRVYLFLEDAELLLHHSTLSDVRYLAPNCSGECKMELSDSFIVGSLLGEGSVHFPDWMQVHHNTLYVNQGEWSGPNCHHNLIAGWVPQRPAMSRNLRVHDPDFVDAGGGDLRLDISPILEDFGVRGPRVPRDSQLGFHVGTTREVLGWSADSKLLVYSEDMDTGHGMCASSLQLWDVRGAAFAELLALANAKGVRRDAGHTQKVEMAPVNPELGVCLNDGAGWRRFSTSEPVLVDADMGPWLSTGPNGAQVLVTDEGQVVLLTPEEAPCP